MTFWIFVELPSICIHFLVESFLYEHYDSAYTCTRQMELSSNAE